MNTREAQMMRSAAERCGSYLPDSRTENEEVIVLQAAENARLRDKLLELANQCDECDGTGLVTLAQTLEAVDAGSPGDVQQECAACHDIRELLR